MAEAPPPPLLLHTIAAAGDHRSMGRGTGWPERGSVGSVGAWERGSVGSWEHGTGVGINSIVRTLRSLLSKMEYTDTQAL